MVLKPCAVASATERDSSNLEEASMEASSVVLKPCAAVTAGEGCSTELEREAMEVSSAVDDSRQRKRKAELDPEKEEESDGEIEEDKIEEREDDDIDLLEVPEWDVDSFDGLVYSSSTEPDLPPRYQPCENMEKAIHDYRIYKQQLITSKGFMVDSTLRPHYLYKRINPVSFDDGGFFRDYCEKMVSGLNVELVEVVRANYRGGPRPKSYITFMAREKPDGPLVEYQAKGMATLDRKFHPILCRPTPTPMPQNQN
ncbi:unnamed protein product [Brassica rapa]|uniref:Uncharacterized protein n=1 Tax=Brassica campestris TaxID=3711 RepID=A0A3P5YEK4_BRACM|nr:unnamed protein product [Brassica rapa]VDC58318.1 unnamed protein product [Brassica rapa]